MNLTIKLRPKTLEEIVGQEHIKKILFKMGFPDKSIKNLYVISGQSGIGKTTLARVMSNMLNGNLIELDGATQGGVDDIKQLQDIVSRRPPIGYESTCIIIDECHNILKRASESLLKLLEELPSYVYVFMCTTSPQEILGTIKTRAFPLQLEPVGSQEMFNYLEIVRVDEELSIPYDMLSEVVEYSKGSVRDGLNLLMQYELEGILKVPNKDILNNIEVALKNIDRDTVERNIKILLSEGFTAKMIIKELVLLCYSKKHFKQSSILIDIMLTLSTISIYPEELLIPIIKKKLDEEYQSY